MVLDLAIYGILVLGAASFGYAITRMALPDVRTWEMNKKIGISIAVGAIIAIISIGGAIITAPALVYSLMLVLGLTGAGLIKAKTIVLAPKEIEVAVPKKLMLAKLAEKEKKPVTKFIKELEKEEKGSRRERSSKRRARMEEEIEGLSEPEETKEGILSSISKMLGGSSQKETIQQVRESRRERRSRGGRRGRRAKMQKAEPRGMGGRARRRRRHQEDNLAPESAPFVPGQPIEVPPLDMSALGIGQPEITSLEGLTELQGIDEGLGEISDLTDLGSLDLNETKDDQLSIGDLNNILNIQDLSLESIGSLEDIDLDASTQKMKLPAKACPHCKTTGNKTIFCSHCGKPFCSNCSEQVVPGQGFTGYTCPNCHNKVLVQKS